MQTSVQMHICDFSGRAILNFGETFEVVTGMDISTGSYQNLILLLVALVQ